MSFVMDRTYDGDKTYEDGKQYADDDKLAVKFEVRAVKNEFESNKAGRPIYYDQEYILVVTPGSRELFSAPVDDHYKARFRSRYDKWKASEDSQLTMAGTLLAELPWMTKSQIAELNYANVFTVEQLVEMSDVNAMKFMGSQQLRQRAKHFLDAAAGAAPALALQQELEQRDLHIQTLNQKLEAMQVAIDKLEKNRK